jgi:hypothetical protein
MHGIVRSQTLQGPPERGRGVSRIVVRYTDGRTLSFTPDAGQHTFSEDDVLELKKILTQASSTAEWADINTRSGF